MMNSISDWLERKLFLKVNAAKTKVVRPMRSNYLGFTFLKNGGEWKVKPTNEKKKKLKKKLREYLKRRKAIARPLVATIKRVNEIVRGWINYFKIGSILTVTRKLDTVIWYRFRMCIWKHWKNPKTRYKNLVKLGISKKNARCAAEFHGYARVCRTKTVCYAMSNARLKKFGLLSAEEYLCKARCQVN